MSGIGAGFIVGGVWAGVFLIIASVNLGWGARPMDDTDSPAGQRSNLELLTDYGTGCQYLRVMGGGVTPRLNAAGKPMCQPKEARQ